MPGMESIAKSTAKQTDAELSGEELELIRTTTVDLASLAPKITNKADLDALIAAVKEANAKNQSVADFKNNLMALGTGVWNTAKQVIALVK